MVRSSQNFPQSLRGYDLVAVQIAVVKTIVTFFPCMKPNIYVEWMEPSYAHMKSKGVKEKNMSLVISLTMYTSLFHSQMQACSNT